MPTRFELVVPRLTERKAQLAVQFGCVRPGELDRVADAVFGDHGVAGRIGLGEEDAEVGRVHPAAAIGAESGVFRDLEAQVLPAAQSAGDLRARAALALPDELGPLRAAEDRLVDPVEVDSAIESATRCPLDVRAERARSGVHVQHSASHCRCHRIRRHVFSVSIRCDFPIDLQNGLCRATNCVAFSIVPKLRLVELCLTHPKNHKSVIRRMSGW